MRRRTEVLGGFDHAQLSGLNHKADGGVTKFMAPMNTPRMALAWRSVRIRSKKSELARASNALASGMPHV